MSEPAARHSNPATAPFARWRRFGMPALALALAVACAANYLEYRGRQVRARSAAAGIAPVVRNETTSASHRQIGIDESGLPSGRDGSLLTFTELGTWSFDPQNPAVCPEAIRARNGRESSCVGFMYPLEAGTRLREFCLLRTTQTCCYGPRPQYNQYLLVEMKEPVKFERFAPVTVSGRFFVDPQPSQGYIYRMEGVSIASAAADEPEADAAQVGRKSGMPVFDLNALGEMARQSAPTVPAAVLALDGKRVAVEGFVLNRREQPSPQLTLAKDWWDGKAQGVPPTLYSAVTVIPRDGSEMPPAWKQKGVFDGTLHVNPDPALWTDDGMVTLRDAVRDDSGRFAARGGRLSGPIVPVSVEITVLLVFLFLLVCFKRRKHRAHDNGTMP